MHRCFISPSNWEDGEIRLSEPELHHFSHVLRAHAGDKVLLFDGAGKEARGEVIDAKKGVIALAEAPWSRGMLPVEIILVQALPKGHKMDLIVEKATELGVSLVIPVITQHTVVQLNEYQAGRRLARWERVALAAARQCGTPWIPKILPIQDYAVGLRSAGDLDLLLAASLEEKATSLESVLNGTVAPKRVGAIIGPEGDLSKDEIDLASEAGAVGVTFGPLVFRVETATLYIASILGYRFLYQGDWMRP